MTSDQHPMANTVIHAAAQLDAAYQRMRDAMAATGDVKLFKRTHDQMEFITASLSVDDANAAEDAAAGLARLPSNVIPLPIPNYHPGDSHAH